MLQNALPIPRRMRSERRRFDGRSAAGVRIRSLIRQYTVAIGTAASDPVTAAAIKRCAELVALSEQARALAIRTGSYDPISLSRIENTARRALRGLRLDQYATEPDEPDSDPAELAAIFGNADAG